MKQVSTESELSFEVTYDLPSLNVAFTVLDDSGPTPVAIGAPAAMLNVMGGMYRAKFTPEFGKTYLVFMGVYTDNTFTTLQEGYFTASDAFTCAPVVLKSGQIVIKKNKPLPAFTFPMLNSTTQNPQSGLTVTAQRSIDGGAFAACANPVVEIGNGYYKIDLAAADLNGDVVALDFTALTADTTAATLFTQG